MRPHHETNVRTAVLLGATRGIGRAIALELARARFRVLVVGRDRAAGEALVGSLGNGAVFLPADLSMMTSIRQLAMAVGDTAPRIDLIVHTADILRSSRVDTAEGIEASFATNFLGRVLFNHLMMPFLVDGATIVHVAAAGFPGRLEAENIPPSREESATSAHNLGQRANDAYGLELAERIKTRGMRVFVLHPGMVATELRSSPEPKPWVVRWLLAALTWLVRPWTVAPDDYAGRLVKFLGGTSEGVLYDRSFQAITPRRRFLDRSRRSAIWARAHEVVGVAAHDTVAQTAGPN